MRKSTKPSSAVEDGGEYIAISTATRVLLLIITIIIVHCFLQTLRKGKFKICYNVTFQTNQAVFKSY